MFLIRKRPARGEGVEEGMRRVKGGRSFGGKAEVRDEVLRRRVRNVRLEKSEVYIVMLGSLRRGDKEIVEELGRFKSLFSKFLLRDGETSFPLSILDSLISWDQN